MPLPVSPCKASTSCADRSTSSSSSSSSPSPSATAPAAASSHPGHVSFCAVQIEISDGAPDVDVAYNRNKSLEDLFFDKLTLEGSGQGAAARAAAAEGKNRHRGRREAGEVRVTTYKDFKEGSSSKEGS